MDIPCAHWTPWRWHLRWETSTLQTFPSVFGAICSGQMCHTKLSSSCWFINCILLSSSPREISYLSVWLWVLVADGVKGRASRVFRLRRRWQSSREGHTQLSCQAISPLQVPGRGDGILECRTYSHCPSNRKPLHWVQSTAVSCVQNHPLFIANDCRAERRCPINNFTMNN